MRVLSCILGCLAVAVSLLAEPATSEPRTSARDLLSPDMRAMQDDDGRNPGMLWVEQGARLWQQAEGGAGKSCASCHRDPASTMGGVAARYPAVDAITGELLNLELRINRCRTTHMQAPAIEYETDALLGLTTFVAHQSRGMPLAVSKDGFAARFYEQGKAFYFERQGQLNVACFQCHDDNVGKRLRGDRISSGLPTGYPAYRLDWQKTGSLHRRLRSCSLGVRGHQYDLGSPEYLALELYLAVRANGVAIETPGVRK